jgi:TolA-binding protein
MDEIRARLDAEQHATDERRRQVVELRQVLDRATALLDSEEAVAIGREAKAEGDLVALQARVEQLARAHEDASRARAEDDSRIEARLAALEAAETRLAAAVSPTVEMNSEQLWQRAGALMAGGNAEEGRRLYRSFIARFPGDPRAPEAYLVIGRSFANEKQFAKAAAEFQRLSSTYPTAPQVPDAMLGLSKAFLELHFCTDARSLLEDLMKRYPRSRPALDAKQEVRTIRKLPKAACAG